MRKKYVIIIAVLIVIVLLLLLVPPFGIFEWQVQDKALDAAYNLATERLTSQSYNLYITDYEIEDFSFKEFQSRKAIIEGTYHLEYGLNAQNVFLEMTVVETQYLRRNLLNQWVKDKKSTYRVEESTVQQNSEERIPSLDDSSYIPFISREDAEQFENITQIAKALLKDFILQASTQEAQKATFVLLTGELDYQETRQIDAESAGEEALNCWKVEGGYYGTYVGYIEDIGYACPFFLENLEDLTWEKLNRKPFYLIETEEGYYLKTEKLFRSEA